MKKNISLSLIIIPLLFACNNSKSEYLKSLHKTELKNSSFYLSIPQNYILEKEEGPDFDMHYFYPEDTCDTESFSGGLYIGFNPSLFSKYEDKAATKTINSEILGKDVEWTIFEYENEIFIQTIISFKDKDGWEIIIHAFGTAYSEEEMQKLIWTLETLAESEDLDI
jgi:hypothetical protein